jgi:ATP-binding cassette subfamily G (WHITE) protein 2 (PDR)
MSAAKSFAQQARSIDATLVEKENDTTSLAEREIQHEEEVLELVRKYTSQSTQHTYRSPFEAAEGSRLDPQSDRFRARDWAKSFYELRYSSEEAVARVAGVAFRGLNVWGKGFPTDFQSTVGNTILKLPALFGRGSQKIEILRNLDGLLLPGEQLCVLGPPG